MSDTGIELTLDEALARIAELEMDLRVELDAAELDWEHERERNYDRGFDEGYTTGVEAFRKRLLYLLKKDSGYEAKRARDLRLRMSARLYAESKQRIIEGFILVVDRETPNDEYVKPSAHSASDIEEEDLKF